MMNRKHRSSRRRREPDPFDGILLVDKPSEWTSHDVVAKIRNHFRFNKVGHGGTLDPLATGLLVLLIGKGTKLSNQIMGGDKVYEGTIHLGITTDSQDADGAVTDERDASHITREQVEAVLSHYVGELEQIPPMVSAIKKEGTPLYKLARKGVEIEREPRAITIHQLDLTGFENPSIHFSVQCSKGTYVRTLAHDIGAELDVGAHLASLRRTASGTLNIDEAYTMEQILACDVESIGDKIISTEALKQAFNESTGT